MSFQDEQANGEKCVLVACRGMQKHRWYELKDPQACMQLYQGKNKGHGKADVLRYSQRRGMEVISCGGSSSRSRQHTLLKKLEKGRSLRSATSHLRYVIYKL